MNTTEIVYPGEINERTGQALGGLGTGTLALDHAGRFQEIRVQNNWFGRIPETPAGSFFSIYTETGAEKRGRILQLKQEGALPCVAGLDYGGDFPFLHLNYKDPDLPCVVTLEAFSPMIPHDPDASSLPLVFFTFKLSNPGPAEVKAAVAFSWQNDISIWNHKHTLKRSSQGKINSLVNPQLPGVLMATQESLLQGSEYLLTGLPGAGVEYAAVADWWNIRPLRCAGPDFDNGNGENFKFVADTAGALELWRPFLEQGRLPPERTFDDRLGRYSYHSPTGAVAGRVTMAPGESREVRFALVWFFPYHLDGSGHYVGHWYAARFPGGTREIAAASLPEYENLRRRSASWQELVGHASLPAAALKFLNNILYLLPRITWRLADGSFTYYEAIACTRMFCVILEQYAAPVMAAFFPTLHAAALGAYAKYQLASGEIPTTLGQSESIHTPEFRVFSPNDVAAFPLAVYTNILWGGDRAFAQEMYPKAKAALQWGLTLDVDNDGIPDCHGVDQGWDTWPMHGAVNYIADLWLAALKAGEKMAEMFNDADFSRRCAAIRAQAEQTVETKLWNGEYYNLSFNCRDNSFSDTSFLDQFAGQTWAWMLGLGPLHPRERIVRAVKNIFRNNIEGSCAYPLSGIRPGGQPDCSSGERSKQSRAFAPCSIGSFAANAMRNGEFDRAVRLMEKTARFVVDEKKEPWLAQLLFDGANGEWFYGFHYVDLLMIWDVMHAVTGWAVNALAGTMALAPPRIPARGPVFTRLFFGEVEFTPHEIILRNAGKMASKLNCLTVEFDGRTTTFENIHVPAGSEHCLPWNDQRSAAAKNKEKKPYAGAPA